MVSSKISSKEERGCVEPLFRPLHQLDLDLVPWIYPAIWTGSTWFFFLYNNNNSPNNNSTGSLVGSSIFEPITSISCWGAGTSSASSTVVVDRRLFFLLCWISNCFLQLDIDSSNTTADSSCIPVVLGVKESLLLYYLQWYRQKRKQWPPWWPPGHPPVCPSSVCLIRLIRLINFQHLFSDQVVTSNQLEFIDWWE